MLLKVTIAPAGGVYNLAQKSEKPIVVSILKTCKKTKSKLFNIFYYFYYSNY